jgi:hypothetical protein
MSAHTARIAASVVAMVAMITGRCPAADGDADNAKAAVAALADIGERQQMLELPVRVVDPDGKPVAKAKVTPWALRSSQGHGKWLDDPKDPAGFGPKDVVTDENGEAIVVYPKYRDVEEGVRTIQVTVNVDHPEFAYAASVHIDVPHEQEQPHEIGLKPGMPVIIRPKVEGADSLDGVFAVWSDGRSWQPGAAAEDLGDGKLRIPAMPPGANSVLLVKLDGERATHFSRIVEFEVTIGQANGLFVPLRPALRVVGKLSDNVPRPVTNGRVKVQTLPPRPGEHDRVDWFTWAPVEEDGTFTIDGWPDGEPMQLIALCDGHIAESGKAPAGVESPPPDRANRFGYPQVFDDLRSTLEVAMTPLQRCVVRAVDEDNQPVAGVKVVSWPNVRWWNGGSQIYCHYLVRGERMLKIRDYMAAAYEGFGPPFHAETNGQGEAILELPVGRQYLAALSGIYELPAFLGRREVNVTLTAEKPAEVTLRLQPRGTEKLGEWDKLAGVVFGCSTREGRRICALPGVQAKMEEFTRRFREAKDQRDPQLLSDAYEAVAEAFTGVGDLEQAALWREKAAAEKAKLREREGKL